MSKPLTPQTLKERWSEVFGRIAGKKCTAEEFGRLIKVSHLPNSSDYMSMYVKSGIIKREKGYVSFTDEFKVKKNWDEILGMFLLFLDEKTGKSKKKHQQEPVQEQQEQQCDQDREHDEAILNAICLLEEDGYVVWTPEEAERVLQGLNLIASVK